MRYHFLKIMIFPCRFSVAGQGCPPTVENVWENHDYQIVISRDLQEESL